MSRYLALVGTPLFVVVVCMLTGFSFLEAIVVFLGGIISLGFVGWLVVEQSRASFIRCLPFWWISKVLGRPGLIYPRLGRNAAGRPPGVNQPARALQAEAGHASSSDRCATISRPSSPGSD